MSFDREWLASALPHPLAWAMADAARRELEDYGQLVRGRDGGLVKNPAHHSRQRSADGCASSPARDLQRDHLIRVVDYRCSNGRPLSRRRRVRKPEIERVDLIIVRPSGQVG